MESEQSRRGRDAEGAGAGGPGHVHGKGGEDRSGDADGGERSGGGGGAGERARRERPASWIANVVAGVVTAAVILGLLAAGTWLGGHPSVLPGFVRGAFEANHESEVANEAIDAIAKSYYRPVSRRALASASIAGAVASLDDPFSDYLTPAEFRNFAHAPHFSGIGVEVAARPEGLLIERVFDSSPAASAGLQRGEVIVAVNGRSLRGVPEKQARGLIIGAPGTAVTLTLRRGQARRTVTVTRNVISEPAVASEMRTVGGHRVAVIALATFDEEGVHAEVAEALEQLLREGAKGVVLDLRHNGGGLVSEARLVASLFISHGVIVSMRGRAERPLTLEATGDALARTQPMAVLVDRDTASASEIVTAALQDHRRATVVGTHTFGKGVFQTVEPLRNGGALDLTVGEYFTPNGRNLGGGGVREGAGVTPEVAVGASQVDGEGGLQAALHAVAAKLR